MLQSMHDAAGGSMMDAYNSYVILLIAIVLAGGILFGAYLSRNRKK